ncbi:MAG: hypothetical protein M1832_000439 [Thelocarpon impressellum]|nr:MAG: hypothetical protein M1832_000439 [Thelocarpon impressellum]
MAPSGVVGSRGRDSPTRPPDPEGFLRIVRYEETESGETPICVTVIPPRSAPAASRWPKAMQAGARHPSDGPRRDSGLGHSASTASGGSSTGTMADDDEASRRAAKTPPPAAVPAEPRRLRKSPVRGSVGPHAIRIMRRRVGTPPAEDGGASPPPRRARISMDIPTGDLFGVDSLEQMSFSNRGSILLAGRKAGQRPAVNARPNAGQRQGSRAGIAPVTPPNGRILSTDEEMLSVQVRSMYERVEPRQNLIDARLSSKPGPESDRAMTPAQGRRHVDAPGASDSAATEPEEPTDAADAQRASVPPRPETEVAGGVEDWEDVDGRDVDRYGFIVARRANSAGSTSSNRRATSPEPPRPQRVSTILQLASDSPRGKRGLLRTPSKPKSSHSAAARAAGKNASTPSLARSAGAPSSSSRPSSRPSSRHPLRYAANRLPGQKHRRCMDEAGDMLTLPPGLANIAEHEEGGKLALELKRREWERAEKWRKMARVTKKGADGQGMEFDFDTKDPKLVARTWKGIPDRWRATAWHAFLSASARKRGDCPSDEQIIKRFGELLEQSSADDMQIDIDVPRTINCHIMFRRRYRGGQRLLFRVLHALSLYFPETGYVQGMASLAATLLCYYDEEHAFVMLVRLWQLRGLERLYSPGFGGLMEALGEFEKTWLAGGDVARKLVSAAAFSDERMLTVQTELNIDPTAYGTRWYLTLFNYSIPFAAQLRVWDVFMLLGDAAPSSRPASVSFHGGLDVLHATSAALIDGTRDILLDSDFENAMKVLTSWVPIRDEELLMRVVGAEWKLRRGKSGR